MSKSSKKRVYEHCFIFYCEKRKGNYCCRGCEQKDQCEDCCPIIEQSCGHTKFWYTVYKAENDELLAYGTASDCAKTFGHDKNSFHSLVSHVKSGINKHYCVVVENLETGEYRVFGANNAGGEKKKIKDITIMGLYADGLNDAQIAYRLGVKSERIRYWRKKKGLPTNGEQGRPRKREEEA